MARLSRDVVVTSEPLQTFPNGDHLYVELSRKSTLYDCEVRMARVGGSVNSLLVARGRGKTIREAEVDCYMRALRRAPYFPKPPYFKRSSRRAPVSETSRSASSS